MFRTIPLRAALSLKVFCHKAVPPFPVVLRTHIDSVLHLAVDTLTFGYIFPATGQIPDFHRLEPCAAGRTIKKDVYRTGFTV